MSSHPRPTSGQSYNASSEDDSLTGHPTLSPPRPFFLVSARPPDDYTPSSTENNSDSDRDLPSSPQSSTVSPRSSLTASSTRKTPRTHRRRSQLALSAQAGDLPQDEQTWTPTSLYEPTRQQRPPPSAYNPILAYPGNAEPLLSHKGSTESIRMVPRSNTATPSRMPRMDRLGDANDLPPPNPPFLSNTASNLPYRTSVGSVSNTTLYRTSAAAAVADAGSPALPRVSSATTMTFRSPFLSPASRPSSTWSPPTPNQTILFNAPSNANSTTALPLPPIQKKAMPSTRLREKLKDEDKPWLALKQTKLERASKWITFGGLLIGIIIAAILVFRGYQSVHLLQDSQLCLVLDDDFTSSTLDTSSWSYDVELDGYGNGEFEMTTNSANNVYLSGSDLYIMPTLTSDTISGGYSAVMDGATYTLDGCTAYNGSVPDEGAFVLKRQYTGNVGTATYNTTTTNGTSTLSGGTNSTNSTTTSNSTSSAGNGANACTAVSSVQAGTVINPVMSGRINTRGKKSIKYGKVEVRAKLPQGDWLWPAIWMLPEGNDTSSPEGTGVYGGWPASGEIDIMEARGNLPTYPAQGSNYVRSTLNYGPYPSGTTPVSYDSTTVGTLLNSLYGWVSTKQGNYASGFHVYAMEWTDSWMRFYTDSRLQAMINLDISSKNTDSYFFNVANFPTVAMNMSSGKYIEIEDPWSTAYNGTAAAPFDQEFYMLIDLAVGGTNGWFPDNVGGKPWYDSSATAMRDFASAQSTWYATWPSSADNRAFRIDYVKMWQLC